MIETISFIADANNVEDVEILIRRCGSYLNLGYKLLQFNGNDKVIEASLSTKEKVKVGFRVDG